MKTTVDKRSVSHDETTEGKGKYHQYASITDIGYDSWLAVGINPDEMIVGSDRPDDPNDNQIVPEFQIGWRSVRIKIQEESEEAP